MGSFVLDSTQTALLSFQPFDAYRDKKIIPLRNLVERIFFSLKEFFFGGQAKNDQKAFEGFYEEIAKKVVCLTDLMSQKEPLETAFFEVEKILRIDAIISHSSWGKNLQEYPLYQKFQQEIEELQKASLEKAKPFLSCHLEHRSLKCWLESTPLERTFAAHYNLEHPPIRYVDIPKGSIILTNPWVYLKKHALSKRGVTLEILVMKIKAILCRFLAGETYTHADLALKKGEVFDLDKKERSLVYGKAFIKDRGKKSCFQDILAPNQEAFVQAYNARHVKNPVKNFDELWEKIEAKARQDAPKVEATPWDIIRVVFTRKRPKGYESEKSWDPENKGYACSATISALLSSFGVSVSDEIGKMDDHVRPSDYLLSKFFTPLQTISPK